MANEKYSLHKISEKEYEVNRSTTPAGQRNKWETIKTFTVKEDAQKFLDEKTGIKTKPENKDEKRRETTKKVDR